MTAKVRIEFMTLAQPGSEGGEDANQPGQVYLVQDLTITGGPVTSAAAPQFGTASGGAALTTGAAKIIALSGAVNVNAWGVAATETNASRVEPTSPIIVPIITGATLSLIEAADATGAGAQAIVAGQVKIATSGQAVPLPAAKLTKGVVIEGLSTNSSHGTVGGSAVTNTVDGTGNGFIIGAGSPTPLIPVGDASDISVNGNAGDIFSFIGA